MIVTAEPYFSVSEPSDLVVLENVIRQDKTQGVLEQVNANYHLLPRGTYAQTAGSHTVEHPITRNEHTPLELFEAQNAIRIAQDAGADQYAAEIMQKAALDFRNASDMDANKHRDEKMEITDAREAVERAEDACIASLRKQAADKQAADVAAKNAAQQQAAASQLQAQQAQMESQKAQMQSQQAGTGGRAGQGSQGPGRCCPCAR